ncbi:MAG: S41 family peptidase, partial [Bacteriovoracaceae bacterium]
MKLSFFLFVLFLGCSTQKTKPYQKWSYKDLVWTSDNVRYQPSLHIVEFEEEIEHLIYALKNAYGAKPLLNKHEFQSAIKELGSLPYTDSPKDLCSEVAKVLKQIPDHHLSVKYNGKQCLKPKVQKVSVGKNSLESASKNWSGKFLKNDIALISIKSFPSGKWKGFLEFVESAKQNAQAIIIDLRQNSGGNDAMGFQMAKTLAGQDIKTPYLKQIKRQTKETLTIWDNYLRGMLSISKNPEQKKALNKLKDENLSLLAKAFKGELPEFHEGPENKLQGWSYDKRKGFQGQIYILQDRGCGSSCESTIDFFEYFPNVTKIGTHTFGSIHFGNIGFFKLKNSGIRITLPTKTNY